MPRTAFPGGCGRAVLLLVLALPLAGCLLNTDEVRVTADHTATIERVAVLSLLDPEPAVNFLSTSAQESSFASASLEGWDAARIVHERLGARLRSKGLDVRAIAPPAALADVYDSGWAYPRTEAVNAVLYEEGVRLGFDMIVVAYPQVAPDFVTDTNQNVRGYGFQRAFDTGPFAFATVLVEAIDIDRRFVAGRADAEQSVALDASLWREAYEQRAKRVTLPAAHHGPLAAALAEILGNSVGIAAQEAGF